MNNSKGLRVLKFSATGNQFALVDLRLNKSPLPLPGLARRLSSEFSTDGLIALRSGGAGALKMDFFNPDGSAAFCGNGTRTAGFYETHFTNRRKKGRVNVLTIDGPRRVSVDGSWASLLNVPEPLIRSEHKVHAGCPHAVFFVKNAESVDVESEGRKIRYSAEHRPKGTNVDFVQVLSSGRLKIRTYERGVERETGSCGSGALASAALARRLGKIKGNRCDLLTRGGPLRVYFGQNGEGLSLEGQVRLIFEGVFYV